jgi:hemerythrin
MAFLEWNDEAIVNHQAMDTEHKKMVDDTNKLYEYVISNKIEEANKLFQKIVDDLETHFGMEENYMKISKIPQYISHKLEHDRFYNKVRSLLTKINAGKKTITLDHLEVVKTWFYNHIKFNDRKLANFLNENNIK